MAAAAVLATATHAETLTGRVVGILDGDTVTVQVERRQLTFRLMDIDAPEGRQAFGSRSKQALSDMCFGKDAKVEAQGIRDGRAIATVYCDGRNANAEQVWQGMAWVFDRYARPGSPLYILQEQARASRRGLWSEPNPTPPWDWRRREWARQVVAPTPTAGSPAPLVQPQAAERKWVCDRKEMQGEDRVGIDCGWR